MPAQAIMAARSKGGKTPAKPIAKLTGQVALEARVCDEVNESQQPMARVALMHRYTMAPGPLKLPLWQVNIVVNDDDISAWDSNAACCEPSEVPAQILHLSSRMGGTCLALEW